MDYISAQRTNRVCIEFGGEFFSRRGSLLDLAAGTERLALCPRSPIGRGNGFKTRPVWVRVPPRALFKAPGRSVEMLVHQGFHYIYGRCLRGTKGQKKALKCTRCSQNVATKTHEKSEEAQQQHKTTSLSPRSRRGKFSPLRPLPYVSSGVYSPAAIWATSFGVT